MTSIILFYMHNCHYCDEFRPTWEKLKEYCKKKNIKMSEYEAGDVSLMQMDQSKNTTGVALDDINGFPTIIILKNGKEIRVQDRREEKIKELLEDYNQTGGYDPNYIYYPTSYPKGDYFEKYMKYKMKYLKLKQKCKK